MINIQSTFASKNRYEKVNSIDYAFAKNKQDVIDTSHSNSRNNEHKHSHIREKQIHQTPLSVDMAREDVCRELKLFLFSILLINFTTKLQTN